MTEETIEKIISDWYLSTPRDISELSEQLLEHHEAEMVLFTEWIRDNYTLCVSNKWQLTNNRKAPLHTTTDLLTLFKNRNK